MKMKRARKEMRLGTVVRNVVNCPRRSLGRESSFRYCLGVGVRGKDEKDSKTPDMLRRWY